MKRLIAVFFATFMVFACSDEYQYNEIELGDGDIGASDKSISYSLRVGDTNNSANPPNWHFSQHDLCHLNLSQNVFSNGATMNNAITAFYIYPGYEITGCDFPNYGPPCYSYEHRVGGFSLAGTSRDNIFSSLEIRPMTPLWTTYTRLEDFPKDRENGFSENV